MSPPPVAHDTSPAPAPAPTGSFRLRPRFEQHVPGSPEAVRDRLLAGLAGEADFFEIKTYPGFIGIHIHGEERHRWSPRLHLAACQTLRLHHAFHQAMGSTPECG